MATCVSIIIPVYNNKILLEKALQSVIRQDEKLYELIVIDGGSTDGTVDVLKQYATYIDYAETEKDKGIYDAMNKGISKASCEWLYFLGSDDTLQPDVLKNVSIFLDKKYDVVYGNVLFDNGSEMESYLGYRTLLQNTLHHQSAFYRRSLFDSFRYDIKLKALADYELNLRIYQKKSPTMYVPVTIARCATGGASAQLATSLHETNTVRARYVKKSWLNAILSIALRLYYGQKQLRFKLYGHRV